MNFNISKVVYWRFTMFRPQKYLHVLRYFLRSYSQLMSPFKSSKLMWPQLPELESTSWTRARCPIKAATSQNMRVIPSVQNLDEAFLTACKKKANINILLSKLSYRPLSGTKTRLHIWWEERNVSEKTTTGILNNKGCCRNTRRKGVLPWLFLLYR